MLRFIAAAATVAVLAGPAPTVAAPQPVPAVQTTWDAPAQLQPAQWRRTHPWTWNGRRWRYRYHGRFCNVRVRRGGAWWCVR